MHIACFKNMQWHSKSVFYIGNVSACFLKCVIVIQECVFDQMHILKHANTPRECVWHEEGKRHLF